MGEAEVAMESEASSKSPEKESPVEGDKSNVILDKAPVEKEGAPETTDSTTESKPTVDRSGSLKNFFFLAQQSTNSDELKQQSTESDADANYLIDQESTKSDCDPGASDAIWIVGLDDASPKVMQMPVKRSCKMHLESCVYETLDEGTT